MPTALQHLARLTVGAAHQWMARRHAIVAVGALLYAALSARVVGHLANDIFGHIRNIIAERRRRDMPQTDVSATIARIEAIRRQYNGNQDYFFTGNDRDI